VHIAPLDEERAPGPMSMMRPSPIVGRRGLAIKYVRDPVSPEDGRRILIDRLWPRGISKERAQLSAWLRVLAPSTELRKWFAHEPARWDEFRRRYRRELEDRGELARLRELRDQAQKEKITLIFGASDREHNDAVALFEFAEAL
jgi:uncharacterized protein YeaO (DUF488 family)